jgi:glycosyl transferase family 25
MRLHVISLERSSARRAALAQRLGALGVSYELFPAVDGAAGYASFEECDSRQYFLNTGRAPSDAEVGCYASHLRLWQLCAASGEPFVIMEDDAAPLPTFTEAFSVTRRLVSSYGFVRLEYDGPSQPARTCQVEQAGPFEVHYFSRYPYGAMCYALTPRVASAFIASSRVLRAPVDQFIKRCWEHGQPLYGLLPYAVREGSHAADSTIRARTKRPLAPGLRARRLVHKLNTSVRRIAFNARWSKPAFRERAWLDSIRSTQPDQ